MRVPGPELCAEASAIAAASAAKTTAPATSVHVGRRTVVRFGKAMMSPFPELAFPDGSSAVTARHHHRHAHRTRRVIRHGIGIFVDAHDLAAVVEAVHLRSRRAGEIDPGHGAVDALASRNPRAPLRVTLSV